MRSVSATLLAEQKKPSRLPYVEAKVYDYEQGIKRLTWERLYTGAEPDAYHGIAFDGQGSMHRIRIDGNNLYRQKVTTPGAGSTYSTWTLVTSSAEGPCAIAASGAKVYIFYRKTDNTLRKYYSHDYGGSWTDAALVSYADVLSMAAAWMGTGDTVVCLALKSNQINGISVNTATGVATQHTWASAVHPLIYTYGIGATYDDFWPAILIVLAGKESDVDYDHFNLYRTYLSSGYSFLELESFLMAPDGEDITYMNPDCHLPASPAAYETPRITAIEDYAGTTAYQLALACHMVKGTYWTDTTYTEPKPFIEVNPGCGFRLASTTDYWWMEIPSGVWRSPRAAGTALDLSADIVSLEQNVIASGASPRGNLIIELDNSTGKYASPGAGSLASLRFRAEIVLNLGYKTSIGNETSEAGTYWIDGWEYRSAPKESTFIITALDAWGLGSKWSARYQMRWNKDAVGPKNVWQIIYQVLARFGIRLWNNPAVTRSSAILNLYPDFTISPGTAGDTALRQLLDMVPDGLVVRGYTVFAKNLLSTEASSYSYTTTAADHIILQGNYETVVPTTRARAIGRDALLARILEEAFDWTNLALGIDNLRQDYDPRLIDATRTQERADAILRQASLKARSTAITVPTNCGQEIYDVIRLTDARVGLSAVKHRVLSLSTRYATRPQAAYAQLITAGAP
jgi:hypothetical protein